MVLRQTCTVALTHRESFYAPLPIILGILTIHAALINQILIPTHIKENKKSNVFFSVKCKFLILNLASLKHL